MKISYIQPPYPDKKNIKPLDTFRFILDQALQIDKDTDLLVTPEYSNSPGIDSFEELVDFINNKSNNFLNNLAEIANDKNIYIATNIIKETEGQLQNKTILFNRTGDIISKYIKIHPTEFEKDSLHTASGNKIVVKEIENIRISFATCFDIYFNEFFQALSKHNPDIIIFPTYQRSEKHHVITAQTATRAMDTGSFIVRSSYSMGKNSETGGKSMIVHPDGNILNTADQQVGIFYAQIDPKEKWMRSKSFGQPCVSAEKIVEKNIKPGIYKKSEYLSPNPFPRIIAHQGFSGACPANTIPAYGAAVAMGADELELDLHPSKDGRLVIMHDDTLDRTTNCTGIIKEMDWDDIKNMDAGIKKGQCWKGIKVPCLEQVFKVFGGQIEFNIHIKDPGNNGLVIRRVQELALKHGICEQIYISGGHGIMKYALKYAPDIARCCLAGQNSWNLVDNAIKYKCKRLQFFNDFYNQQYINKAHEFGILCNLYYADTYIEASRSFQEGIDAVLTNELAETLPVLDNFRV